MKKNQENNILDKSYALFLDKGYNDTTMQDIITETKISKWGIYHYFKSKEEILDRIIDKQLEELFLSIRKIFEDTKLNPVEKLKKYIDLKNQYFRDKYDLIKTVYSQEKHLIIRHFISQKIKNELHPYIIKIFEEWQKLGFFKFEYSEQTINIFLSVHDFMFNYAQDIIKDKKEFELHLLAVKSLSDKIFNF